MSSIAERLGTIQPNKKEQPRKSGFRNFFQKIDTKMGQFVSETESTAAERINKIRESLGTIMTPVKLEVSAQTVSAGSTEAKPIVVAKIDASKKSAATESPDAKESNAPVKPEAPQPPEKKKTKKEPKFKNQKRKKQKNP